jgi:hypothetical protein
MRRSSSPLKCGTASASVSAEMRPGEKSRPFERALESYVAGIEEARRDGLTRVTSADAAERSFAIGFALEQMHQNLVDHSARRTRMEVARAGRGLVALWQAQSAFGGVPEYQSCTS